MGFIEDGIQEYYKRIIHYVNFEIKIVPDLKHAGNLSEPQRKEEESKQIMRMFDQRDFLVLLDERGKILSTSGFSDFLQQRFMDSSRNPVFVIGGAYGFSQKLYKKSNMIISLSKMTFSHQIIRIIFLEQLYRALTILKGDPYHHG